MNNPMPNMNPFMAAMQMAQMVWTWCAQSSLYKY